MITEVSFSLAVSCNSSGLYCNHIDFLYDPRTDRISEVSIQGVKLEPAEAFEQMIWRLYPKAELYKAACGAIENAPNLPRVLGA
jgi:hypothetical protein